jgi:hypothetical protein
MKFWAQFGETESKLERVYSPTLKIDGIQNYPNSSKDRRKSYQKYSVRDVEHILFCKNRNSLNALSTGRHFPTKILSPAQY